MNDKQSLVATTLAEVAALRAANFCGDDSHILLLLDTYEMDNEVAELLWRDLPANVDLHDVADLLSLWAWRDNDNGARTMRTLERWIASCSDEQQVWVALHQDAYPFLSHVERIAHLRRIQEAFPSLSERCEMMTAQTQQWISRDFAAGLLSLDQGPSNL